VSDEPSARQAADSLPTPEVTAEKKRQSARWMGIYMAVFGVGFGLMGLLIGLVGSHPAAVLGVLGAWSLVVGVMVFWSARQGAVLAMPPRRTVPYWAGSAVLYAVGLFGGLALAPGDVRFWIPAAAVIAVPLLIGAWREAKA